MLKNHFKRIPLLAVTATASDKVREDCCTILNIIHNYQCFKSTANRPNLTYEIRVKSSENKTKITQDMANFIKSRHPTGSGIVYTFSKREAEEVAAHLSSLGIPAEPYHAEVNATTKERIQKNWMKNRIQVVVATIAFGLGINKPDVRFVLHHR
jgi:superfamily II DNA helicase RecQ